ncbi:DEAD/DEAH box helicase [Sanguibacter inulinus]|uniref:DEAD/DEAH box helicase n=1 Tax=Sanguibacter inulinus TaxID=60922 RepID=A0A853ENY3_9MICO|nr:DEAD/DEAH box helicase [Sanguibacter inulinus]MBF0721106.1 DEAD/DEAH box helicase [Sanguibacter inulinus]NYS92251.1 DEAD/DEAH box helicase [Sanguibacter inulinus]
MAVREPGQGGPVPPGPDISVQTAKATAPGPSTRPGAQARRLVDAHVALAASARAVLDHLDGATTRIAEQVHSDRAARTRAELDGLTVDRLTEITDKNLRIRALLDAGYTTVGSLLGVSAEQLETLDGVGSHTARSTVAAVEQLADATAQGQSMRITLDRDDATGTRLLGDLELLVRLGPLVEPHRRDLDDYARSVEQLAEAASQATNALTFAFRRRATRRRALDALAALEGWTPWLASTGLEQVVARLMSACAEPGPGPLALWDDFERRSAVYYTVLGAIVPLVRDVLAATGMLPSELADRVDALTLDTSLLDVSLRGYQAFGAKFVLNQGRVLLGDEMGLGKTVQAVAVMAHLVAAGATHILVVCPASVLVGWLREIDLRSSLQAWRVHGPEREAAAAAWLAQGGVAVTTFEGLRHVPEAAAEVLDLLVVDEAHLVKNPRARRSQDVAAWADRCWRVLLMTGTPLENRLDEFLGLVRMLQPALVDSLPPHLRLVGADTLRHTMAPVYLRRNAADVLVELPDLVELDEWEELTPDGRRVYEAAVAAGRFMDMRRADFATPDPSGSSKLGRLLEILEDAAANGEKVVVFSYFRSVVDLVCRTLAGPGGRDGAGPQTDAEAADLHPSGLDRADLDPAARGLPAVFGPLWGGVSADERQLEVDRFTAAPPGAVLVAQVDAGGVGLNIQAANVVVLCEPQLKPTTEAQAVARVRRMGQVRPVRVHRLLVEDTVDERIREILATKQQLFDEYVRESSLAAGTTRAVDVSEAVLAREVVAAEQARLGYGPVWDDLLADDLQAGTEAPLGDDAAADQPVDRLGWRSGDLQGPGTP